MLRFALFLLLSSSWAHGFQILDNGHCKWWLLRLQKLAELEAILAKAKEYREPYTGMEDTLAIEGFQSQILRLQQEMAGEPPDWFIWNEE